MPIARPSYGPISSTYGYRKLAGEPTTLHSGVDFVGGVGSPIRAVKDGTVLVAAPNGTYNRYGNVVVIKHDDPSEAPLSLYAHMNSIAVHKGQHVRAGRIIGGMGHTSAEAGNPTHTVQTHLHFELLKSWPLPPDVGRIDPSPFLVGATPPKPVPAPPPTYAAPFLYSYMTPAVPPPTYAALDPAYSSSFGDALAPGWQGEAVMRGLLTAALIVAPFAIWRFIRLGS